VRAKLQNAFSSKIQITTFKTIELQTDGTLQREQVLKAADLHEGANIFSVNLAKVRDRIQQLPRRTKLR
jgi:cell division septal protein FtsQ